VYIYIGQTNDKNKRHGKGKLTCPDGTYYDGEWKNGDGYMTKDTVKVSI
jgi:hypothetical protein